MENNVKVSLTKSQLAFLDLKCPFPGFFGGYGCGKSHLMTLAATLDAMHSSNTIVALYEPEFSHIRDIVVPHMETWLNKFGIRYNYNKQDHIIYTSSGKIGDFILKSLDNPSTIVGYESYRAHIDEIDTLPMHKAQEAWFKIMGRNRQRPKGLAKSEMVYNSNKDCYEPINRISAYSTPEGYKFAHKMWVQNNNKDFQYIKGRTEDNPHLPESYISQLKASYPPQLIEAYMNGEFVNMTSGTVYNCYDREVCDSRETIQKGENLYIGCDFNVMNQAATIFVCRDGGIWHAVEELKSMRDTPEMIRIIKEKYEGHTIYIYPDASGRSRHTTNAANSDISLLIQAGFNVRARSRNPDVRDRVQSGNRAFTQGKVKVNHMNCPTVARCLEQQAYDDHGKPDKDSGFDHQNDATTYFISYEMPINKPLYAVPMRFVSKHAN